MKGKRYVSKGIMVTILFLFFGGLPLQSSWAKAEDVKLKLATFCSSKGSVGKGITWFVDEVSRRTDGRVKIKIFWSQSLAKFKELPDACRTGMADMVAMVPVMHFDFFPYISSNMEWLILWGGDVGKGVGVYRKMREQFPQFRAEFRKQNQKLIAFWEYDKMGIISKKPLKSLADMKGVKLRCAGAILPKIYAGAGFVPVGLPTTEAYDAANRGIVDAIVATYDTAYKWKWYEVCKNYTHVGILGSTVMYGITINLDKWDKLPPDIKNVLELVGRELTDRYPVWLVEDRKAQEKILIDAGVKFYDLPVAEREVWLKKVARSNFEEYVNKMEKRGYPDTRKVLQRYGELLGYKPWEYGE